MTGRIGKIHRAGGEPSCAVVKHLIEIIPDGGIYCGAAIGGTMTPAVAVIVCGQIEIEVVIGISSEI